jgi:tRNA (cytidine32/uridine32-2'-O)-methyltransferase
MGLGRLYLINPVAYSHQEGMAYAMSAGAQDILCEAVCVSTLDEAVSDCTLLLGTSARTRGIQWPLLDPAAAATAALRESGVGRVAILFGNENSGLQNEELQRCHYHVKIPTDPHYSSLNLAQAVQVMAYEIRKALEMNGTQSSATAATSYATLTQLESYYQHLDRVLHTIKFIDDQHPNQIMPRLRRLYNRARLSPVEVNILRGILTETERALAHATPDLP